jgi:DNA replicative helicase MCM subunit Mcm2 (Cdc46/Mcm family)
VLPFSRLRRPDEIRDRQLSEHIMSMHDNERRPQWSAAAGTGVATTIAVPNDGGDSRASLGRLSHHQQGADDSSQDPRQMAYMAATQAAHQRAQKFAGAMETRTQADTSPDTCVALDIRLRRGVLSIPAEEIIPPVLLRKYVAYSRRHCYPALLPEAASVLQEFYLRLRKQHGTTDSTPITTRQLESMIRLAEARAKVELREFVTRADAEDVIAMMKEALFDAATDEFGYGASACTF